MNRRCRSWLSGAVLVLVTAPVWAGIAILREPPQSLFEIYEDNRQQGRPNFITEDLLLLTYALIQQQAWAQTEREQVQPRLHALLDGLSAAVADDADAPGLANREFLALLQALLADRAEGLAGARAQAEWRLVQAAAGIAPSPLFGASIDYSQFRPRGRYAESPQLAAWFRTVRYAQAALFGVQPSRATGLDAPTAARLAAQAARLAQRLGQDERLAALYTELETGLAAQFGPADDLTVADVQAVLAAGDDATTPLAERLQQYARSHARLPRILGAVVDASALEPGLTPAMALTGWRLLAARYTPEAAAMQALVHDRVGRHDCRGECPTPFTLSVIDGQPVKGFPSVFELLALLGSQEARSALQHTGEDRYEGYAAAYASAGELLAAAGDGPAGERLALLRTGLASAADSGIHIVNRAAALLGFWTYQRRLDQLYTKQSYTLSGKGLGPMPGTRAGARLEHRSLPLLEALARLVAHEQARSPHPARLAFAELLGHCIEMAGRRQAGEPASADDEAFLNELDRALRGLADGGDAPVVVDLHTSAASGEVLELATGAHAVRSGPAVGARFTIYEFRQPLAERLTDAAWDERLRRGEAPIPLLSGYDERDATNGEIR